MVFNRLRCICVLLTYEQCIIVHDMPSKALQCLIQEEKSGFQITRYYVRILEFYTYIDRTPYRATNLPLPCIFPLPCLAFTQVDFSRIYNACAACAI